MTQQCNIVVSVFTQVVLYVADIHLFVKAFIAFLVVCHKLTRDGGTKSALKNQSESKNQSFSPCKSNWLSQSLTYSMDLISPVFQLNYFYIECH